MTFTLALDELTDEELVELIRRGEPAAAARFWVRHWPTALSAARGLVEPAEVPGLAAEALVGTLATIRVGSGPASHAAVFVIDAVHELGGEEYSSSYLSPVSHPDVFASPTLAAAFATLRIEDQQLLWAAMVDGVRDADVAAAVGITATEAAARRETALGNLQESAVQRRGASAVDPDCAATHTFLAAAISDPGTTLPHQTWMHMSECVVCTESFHELAHTPTDLGALLGAAAFPGPLPVVAADLAPEPTSETATETAAATAEEHRRRRPLLLGLGAAALAGAIAVTAILLSGGADPVTPSAAQGTPTSTPSTTVAPPALLTAPSDPVTSRTAKPKATATTPASSPTAAATSASSTPAAAPTKKPTKKPTKASTSPAASPTSSTPTASGSPSTSPTPTTTPSATPTCTVWKHLWRQC